MKTVCVTEHLYKIRPRKDKRGVHLISDGLPFGELWCGGPNATDNAIGYAKFYSRSHDAIVRLHVMEVARAEERGFLLRGK